MSRAGQLDDAVAPAPNLCGIWSVDLVPIQAHVLLHDVLALLHPLLLPRSDVSS